MSEKKTKDKTLEDLYYEEHMEEVLKMVAQRLGISVRAARRYLPAKPEEKS